MKPYQSRTLNSLWSVVFLNGTQLLTGKVSCLVKDIMERELPMVFAFLKLDVKFSRAQVKSNRLLLVSRLV